MSAAPAADRLAANIRSVRDRIARAAAASGRSADDVRLVAVSKTFPLETIAAAAAAGLEDFGEKRVQEALGKMEPASDLPPIRWHLIGHLQSNKARQAAAKFDWIHSVDSVKLLRRLDAAAVEAGTRPALLIQADLGGEAQKHGAGRDEVRRLFDAAADCRAVESRGLMLIPPWNENPEETRPYFRQLRELRDTLHGEGVPESRLAHLSMGMSHDFEAAVEEGATMVRVGTGLFGRRTPIR